ncbi:MAG TPA: RHS repeat-associated core domain-containing protein [Stellaceae bacterium]|nr:RHS repeat-associated core domain-containing protein [Stellaceae bacterium]
MLTRKTRKGDTIAFTWDTLNRLSTKTAPGEATVTYGYDLAGRLTGVSDFSAAIAAPSTTASYTATTSWDALNRPLAVSWGPATAQTAPAASAVTFTHGYDPTNRRISQTATDKSWWSYPAAAGSTAYTTNNLDQYTQVGAAHPTYDGNGNPTFDGVFTYGYDAESRLVSIKQGAATIATYAYDAQGRRKSKTVGSTTTIYVTDADNREVLEYDGTTGAVQRWYAFGQGPDAVLGQMNIAAGTRTTLIPDLQGSIIGLLDSGGSLTRIGYQPYGENPTLTSGTYRYTARRFDPETAGSAPQPSGLYYYRARVYSPTWGRFLQPDPLGYAGGSNLYAYVGNDPLNRTDPSGLCDNPQGCRTSPAIYLPSRSAPIAAFAAATSPLTLSTGQSGPLDLTMPELRGPQAPVLAQSPQIQLAADITGFRKHGIDQVINRNVSPSAILDAVVNPIRILPQPNGTTRYIGGSAVVVLNPAGEVVTVWGQ